MDHPVTVAEEDVVAVPVCPGRVLDTFPDYADVTTSDHTIGDLDEITFLPELAESILRACGVAIWLTDEKHMDAVTALSGSGPAYFFLVMEAMENAAVELGLPPETARLLCLETAFGAAKMALESGESASILRQQVTSPGGTTEKAIHELEDGGLHGLFENALVAAALRARELANELGQDHA